MTGTIRHAMLALPLLALLPAAGAVEVVKMVYEPATETVPKPVVQGCAVNIAALTDQRPNRETIGRHGPAESLVAPDMLPWLGSALGRLGAYGYTVTQGAAAGPAVQVEVKLVRAYTFPLQTHVGAMLALEVATPGAAPMKVRQTVAKYWRNWSGVSNHVTALNMAADVVVAELAARLKAACAAPPAP